MKTYVCIAILVLVGVAAKEFAQTSPSAQPCFSLIISTAESRINTGSEMKLLIKKRNLSKHDIIHSTAVMGGKAFSQSDITVVIRDSNGNAVKETPLGREMHGTGPHHPESGSVFNGRTILKPGDVIQLETKANREYDLTKPGTYTVQAQEKDSETQRIVLSNVITITVTE